MIDVAIEYNGWLSTIMEGKPSREAKLKAVARRVLKQVMAEFATRTGRASLDFRFSPDAWGELNLAPRSASYAKWGRRVFGRPLPFYSPRLRMDPPHLRQRIRVPDDGHRITSKNTGTLDIAAQLYLSGAKVLNFHPEYRAEFLNLTRGGRGFDPVSATWIKQRFAELFVPAVKAALMSGRKRAAKVA